MTTLLISCYKDKADIETLTTVSFRNDVVPIVTSGSCGCHNNGVLSTAVQFSHLDTIFFPTILARVANFKNMVEDSTKHPGGGGIQFSPNQKLVIQNWIAQGAKDDGGGCIVSGAVTYNNNILPIYNTTCKSSTCHGTVSVALTYSKMVSDKDILTAMMNSGGATGHLGPVLSLNSCTTKTILAWIAQGQPQ
ncbi:MAG: hypothetical protein EBV82_05450 [Chitinophagia bacterium]|nr:hypothetical protein [Chitinophagia bacterium]